MVPGKNFEGRSDLTRPLDRRTLLLDSTVEPLGARIGKADLTPLIIRLDKESTSRPVTPRLNRVGWWLSVSPP